MKFIAILLSVYILVLTTIPCVDKPEDTQLPNTVLAAANHSAWDQDIDHCSPFCTCNCCSSPKIQQDIVMDFNSYQFFQANSTEYFMVSVTPHVAVIWQPPRLG